MDPVVLAGIIAVLLFVLLGAGLWVAVSLVALGVIGLELSGAAPPGAVLGTTVWGSTTSWTLTALPLFIWMGEILFRTRLSDQMFEGLAPWLGRIPGRLLHVNVLGCSIFAAVSGSSVATTVTIGKIALPELAKRGYDERLAIGTLAGSGTLGLLIPPSIIMIVYGVAADVSIVRLFVAGVLPGLMVIGLFMAYVVAAALFDPARAPRSPEVVPFLEKIWRARRLIPVLILIASVLGSIYGGIATATEAAAIGVLGALVIAATQRSLTWRTFFDSVIGATRASCMICFILAASAFLSVAMDYAGLSHWVADAILSMGLSRYALLAVLTLVFILLGCFLDGISIVVLSTSLLLVAVKQVGIDPLWFGIYLVIVVEMSLITPPVGLNLFVLQGMTGRNLIFVSRAALPFFLLMVVAVALLVAFPGIATYLPGLMFAR
ncbi:MAG: TRAP transporter large permease [Alphaproteobacteria bacterium]